MQRNSMNQDNDRANGSRQMNRGFENDQQRDNSSSGNNEHSQRSFGGYEDNRSGTNRSFGGYDDNRWTGSQGGFDQGSRSMSGYRGTDRSASNYRNENYGSRHDEAGYGGSQYSGYRGTDDRSHRSYGTDDRGFSGGNERHPHDEHERGRWGQDHDRGYRTGGEERHPHDEHERGRWGTDYQDHRGHRYQGGIIDDNDHHRREEAFQRSGYQSHGMYNRSRSGVYQDRDNRGRFNDTGEGRSYGQQGYTGGYERGYQRNNDQGDHGRFGGSDAPARNDFDHRMDRDDRSRFSSDDNRRYGSPSYGYEPQQSYGRGGYGRDDRHRDEQRGMGGSVASDRFGRNDHDSDRRWTGGGYEEDRRGRGRGRY